MLESLPSPLARSDCEQRRAEADRPGPVLSLEGVRLYFTHKVTTNGGSFVKMELVVQFVTN